MKERFRFECEMRDLGLEGEFSHRDYQSFNADDIAQQLQPIFRQKFSFRRRGVKNPILYGPRLNGNVRIELLPEADFLNERKAELLRRADEYERQALKFTPELIRDKLLKYYNAINKPFPGRLNVIDENTRLNTEEKTVLFTLLKALLLDKAESEIKMMEGFYSSTTDRIIIKDSAANVAVLAHEMAHAYADPVWHEFISLMALRNMKNVTEVDEGITTLFERLIVSEWIKRQKGKSIAVPPAVYDTKIAIEFIKLLGWKAVYESYFGGAVENTNINRPEDSLIFGASRKSWRWKWR